MPSGSATISRQERIEALAERVLWAALCGMAARADLSGLRRRQLGEASSPRFVASRRRSSSPSSAACGWPASC